MMTWYVYSSGVETVDVSTTVAVSTALRVGAGMAVGAGMGVTVGVGNSVASAATVGGRPVRVAAGAVPHPPRSKALRDAMMALLARSCLTLFCSCSAGDTLPDEPTGVSGRVP